jgi:hypothetical protein
VNLCMPLPTSDRPASFTTGVVEPKTGQALP